MYRHGIAIGEDGKRVQGKPARAKERARVSRRRDEAEAWAQARLQGLTNDPAPINKIGMIYLAVNYPQLVDSSIEKDNDNRQANDATGKLSAVIGGEQQTDAHFNPLVERTRSQSDFRYPSAGTVILNPPTTNQVSTMMRINHGCPICFKHYTYDRVHDDVTTICCDKEVGRSCFEQSFHLIHRCWFCGTFNSQIKGVKPLIPLIRITPSPENQEASSGAFSTKYDGVLSGYKPSRSENLSVPGQKTQSELEDFREPRPSEILAVIFKPRSFPHVEPDTIPTIVVSQSENVPRRSASVPDLLAKDTSPSILAYRAACVAFIKNGTYRRRARSQAIEDATEMKVKAEEEVARGEAEDQAKAEEETRIKEEWKAYLRGNIQRSDVLIPELLEDFDTNSDTIADNDSTGYRVLAPPGFGGPVRQSMLETGFYASRIMLPGQDPLSDSVGLVYYNGICPSASVELGSISVANPFKSPHRQQARNRDTVIPTYFKLTPANPQPPVHIASTSQNRAILAVPISEAVHIARSKYAMEVTRRALGVSPLNLLSFLAVNVPAIDANPEAATNTFGGRLPSRHGRVIDPREDDGTWRSNNWSGYRLAPAALKLTDNNYNLDALALEARISREIVQPPAPVVPVVPVVPAVPAVPVAPAVPSQFVQSQFEYQYQHQHQYQYQFPPAIAAAFQNQFNTLAHAQQAYFQSQAYHTSATSQYGYGYGHPQTGGNSGYGYGYGCQWYPQA